MASMPKIQFKPGGKWLKLKSLQYGTITIASGQATGTAIITSVATANAILVNLDSNPASGNTQARYMLTYITLTNSTTVTATRNTAINATVLVGFCVVEFVKLKSCQYGTVSLSTTQKSNTATITSVNTSIAMLIYLGNTTSNTCGVSPTYDFAMVSLTNFTTVTATVATQSYAHVVGFVVAEMVPS